MQSYVKHAKRNEFLPIFYFVGNIRKSYECYELRITSYEFFSNELLSRISIENDIKINIKNVNVYECNHSSKRTLLKINVNFDNFVEKRYLHDTWLSVFFPFFEKIYLQGKAIRRMVDPYDLFRYDCPLEYTG